MLNQSLDHLTAYVSTRSLGGKSLFAGDAVVNHETIRQYCSEHADMDAACARLADLGFQVERARPLSTRITGSADLFRDKFGLDFEKRAPEGADEKAVPWQPTMESTMNLIAAADDLLEGIVFPQPVELHDPNAQPPSPSYHHLKVPDDIVRLLNAEPVHAAGFKGQSVQAAMIDSGFHWSHPYFRARDYKLRIALQAEGVLQDANGHGTGESANLLAVAPEVTLHGLAMDDIVEAFSVARDDLGVQIISNSWGSRFATDGPNGTWHPFWTLVEAEIALCVNQGIVVMFSGGNGGMSFTASMPETISVGGVYADENGGLKASDYASSFDSTRYPGEHVPEVCGLVGLRPAATYITLPVPPESEIDRARGGGNFPSRDETRSDDGWAVFSGTSAACPMVAGVVALILSKHPGEDLDAIRQRLRQATDVTRGVSSMGDAAGPGHDAATGYGLVDAERACA